MNSQVDVDYDLIIVGAGMVGSSLALGLSHTLGSKLKVAVIEAVQYQGQAESNFDDRSLALSLSTQRILSAFDLWQEFTNKLTPIEKIHVSEQHRFASVRMNASTLGLPALAYVLPARELGCVLLDKIKQMPNLDFICPANVREVQQSNDSVQLTLDEKGEEKLLRSRLVVLADGSLSKVRSLLGFKLKEKDYGQHAIVANVSMELEHQFTAYERFNIEGPFALLPSGSDRCGMVFSIRNNDLQHYMALDDEGFMQAAEQRFGRRLGRFTRIGKRKSYPLRLIEAKEAYKGRVLLLGNSAHTIHPNMAQGFNLGLRDVAGLVEVLSQVVEKKQDIGSKASLETYLALRQEDQNKVIQMTDGLTRIFYNDDVIKSALRNMGLLVTDLIPAIKKPLMQQAMGIRGKQPQCVRQL